MVNEAALDRKDKGIDLLLFEVDGIYTGIDTEQVEGVFDSDIVKQKIDVLLPLNALYPTGNQFQTANAEKVLIINHPEKSIGVTTGMPVDLISVSFFSIKPLPDVFNAFQSTIPVWGVTVLNRRIVLLIDIIKFTGLVETIR